MTTRQLVQLGDDAVAYVNNVTDSVKARLLDDASAAAHLYRRASPVLAERDIRRGMSLRRRRDQEIIRVLLARRLFMLVGIAALIGLTFAVGTVSLTYSHGRTVVFIWMISILSLLLTGILYSFMKTYFDGGAVVSAYPLQFFPRSSKEDRKQELVVQWDTLEGRMRVEAEKAGLETTEYSDLGSILRHFAEIHELESDELRKALQARNSIVHGRPDLTIERLNDTLNYLNSVLQRLPGFAASVKDDVGR